MGLRRGSGGRRSQRRQGSPARGTLTRSTTDGTGAACRPSVSHLLPRLESALGPRVLRLGVALLAAVLVFGLLHSLAVVGGGPFDVFRLERELVPPAFFSAALLAAGSAAFLRAAGTSRLKATAGLFGALLGLMALDEVLRFHELLEAASGVDWQLLYAPVFLLGGVAALLLLLELRSELPPAVLLCAGGAAWTISQVLEAVQWDGDRRVTGYGLMMPVEELLEMSGSALFLLAGVHVLLHRAPRNGRGGNTDPPTVR